MLTLTQGQTAEVLIVTLNEKRTITSGYYLFLFTHILTKQEVTKVFAFVDDDSGYQERYNSFGINTSLVFVNRPVGQWVYKVYEQSSAVNTDPTGLTEVERGLMYLNPAVRFEFEMYEQGTSYKTYEQALGIGVMVIGLSNIVA